MVAAPFWLFNQNKNKFYFFFFSFIFFFSVKKYTLFLYFNFYILCLLIEANTFFFIYKKKGGVYLFIRKYLFNSNSPFAGLYFNFFWQGGSTNIFISVSRWAEKNDKLIRFLILFNLIHSILILLNIWQLPSLYLIFLLVSSLSYNINFRLSFTSFKRVYIINSRLKGLKKKLL